MQADECPLHSTLADARARLAAEWQTTAPRTPAEIRDFYRQATHLAEDLDAWHATPERQSWTDMLVHVARQSGARLCVDIGAGCGHDLLALRDATPQVSLAAVEGNLYLLSQRGAAGLVPATPEGYSLKGRLKLPVPDGMNPQLLRIEAALVFGRAGD